MLAGSSSVDEGETNNDSDLAKLEILKTLLDIFEKRFPLPCSDDEGGQCSGMEQDIHVPHDDFSDIYSDSLEDSVQSDMDDNSCTGNEGEEYVHQYDGVS